MDQADDRPDESMEFVEDRRGRVLALQWRGATITTIARVLGLSPATVRADLAASRQPPRQVARAPAGSDRAAYLHEAIAVCEQLAQLTLLDHARLGAMTVHDPSTAVRVARQRGSCVQAVGELRRQQAAFKTELARLTPKRTAADVSAAEISDYFRMVRAVARERADPLALMSIAERRARGLPLEAPVRPAADDEDADDPAEKPTGA